MTAQLYDLKEEARIKVLEDFRVLDTPAEPVFDKITELAAYVFQADISLISFVDQGRQWFKSLYGMAVRSTPREFSFCSHAIQNEEIYCVKDATRDPLFKHNPLVTGAPFIRSYYGSPLRTECGMQLGTLCVISKTVIEPSEVQLRQLRDLSQLTMAELTMRRKQLQDFWINPAPHSGGLQRG
ncbi:MAG: GAF domain-containing protein [Pseudomonadota bacterium]